MSVLDQASLVQIPSGYKVSKLYSQVPTDGTGDLDFTRSTTATRVNESGLIETVAINVPRLDFTGGGCGKYLFEPQRTNLVTYSNDFSNSNWNTFRGSIVSNSSISPDNTNNASFFKEDSTNNTHVLRTIYNVTNGLTYSFSVFVKKNSIGRNLQLNCGTTNNEVNFNLQNGTIISSSSSAVGNITEIGDYYRCEITAGVTNGNDNFDIRLLNNTSDSYLGDGVSGIDIYGVNIEQGEYPTSYIPTSGSTVTRTEDASSTSGLSSVINSEDGVLYIDAINDLRSGLGFFSLSDGSNSNAVSIKYSSSAISFFVDVAGARQYSETISLTYGVRHKIALQFKNSKFSYYIDGVKYAEQLSGSIFSANTLSVLNNFQGAGGINFFNGKINELSLFNNLTDSQLIALTTI